MKQNRLRLPLRRGAGERGSLVFLTLLLLNACARCTPSTPDAGPPPLDAGPARLKHSTDLRTALLVSFPEYRGVELLEGRASLTRKYVSLADDAFARAAQGNGFKPALDGGLTRPPLRLDRPASDTAVIWLPVDLTTVEKVFQSPIALSSMELGLYLPRGLPIADERFELSLRYRAHPAARAAFLTRQLVELLRGNGQWALGPLPDAGWLPMPTDGGYGGVPDAFEVTVRDLSIGAQLTVSRSGAEVRVHYELATDVPAH